MNYAESFDQFSSKLSPTDIALYAGAGLILWVFFKNKLSPVQEFLTKLLNNIKSSTKFPLSSLTLENSPVPVVVPSFKPVIVSEDDKQDIFFKLVVSWKQTRDLAIESGCEDAVRVADEMFPYLSPHICGSQNSTKVEK
jgi:hypothetical protein